MTSTRPTSKTVFVGNIPYGATEDLLKEIFTTVGPVVNFRLVVDRENGKPKGYGFCEYRDTETALSAIRNLNNYDLDGRPLRVDFSDNEGRQQQQQSQQQQSVSQQQSTVPGMVPIVNTTMSGVSNTLPTVQSVQMQPLVTSTTPQTTSVIQSTSDSSQQTIRSDQQTQQRTVTDFKPTIATPETIYQIVEGFGKDRLNEALWSIKTMSQQNPEQARQILQQNPQLAIALLQAEVLLGVIDQTHAKQLLGQSTQSQQTSQSNPSTLQPTPTIISQTTQTPIQQIPTTTTTPMVTIPSMQPITQMQSIPQSIPQLQPTRIAPQQQPQQPIATPQSYIPTQSIISTPVQSIPTMSNPMQSPLQPISQPITQPPMQQITQMPPMQPIAQPIPTIPQFATLPFQVPMATTQSMPVLDENMLRLVMTMSNQQLDALPPQHRNNILHLRAILQQQIQSQVQKPPQFY